MEKHFKNNSSQRGIRRRGKAPVLLATMVFLLSGIPSLFGNIIIDGAFGDWSGGGVSAGVTDPKDMVDPNGDIRRISARVENGGLHLQMTVDGLPTPTDEEVADGDSNRYYYHWILDTDNDPATGFSNAEYEGNPTNLNNPIGVDLVIQIGWRNNAPDGVNAYNPLTEEEIVADFVWGRIGNTLHAYIPLADLGLSGDQTIGLSAFQEGQSDGWSVDWIESTELTLTETDPLASVDDPTDMVDPNGDIRRISAQVEDGVLHLQMTVQNAPTPSDEEVADGDSNRYYYHWILDTDNDPATGFSNAEYEGNPTNLNNPIGVDLVVQVGWRNNAPDGVNAYDPLTEEEIVSDFVWGRAGDTLHAFIPLEDLGLTVDQTIGLSAFQEGQSDGWSVDWIESAIVTLSEGAGAAAPQAAAASVTDPEDMVDPNGDIRAISARVENGALHLQMTVTGFPTPGDDEVADGDSNRYYYHWILDTDNDPATGFSNAEYEGNPTNLNNPIGVDVVIQVGWRNNAPDGVNAYNPLTEEELVDGFAWGRVGNTLHAIIPLSDLGLIADQTIGFSAFQEGQSDGWSVDWVESAELTLTDTEGVGVVMDPSDMVDPNGDIRKISARVENDVVHLQMQVYGAPTPSDEEVADGDSNRYYYHWILDTDNDPATGFSNAEYEGNPTNLNNPIGVDVVIQIGWRNNAPDGVNAYNPLTEEELVESFVWGRVGDTLHAIIPLADLGLTADQTIGFSAFQEGQSDGWSVDWIESSQLTLSDSAVSGGSIAKVEDPSDMVDPNGDIQYIQGVVCGEDLFLRMAVYGVFAPSPEETGEGMSNRHYYHWLIDSDNDPATGFSNSEYEGNPTNLNSPIGADLVIQIGWRNGAPDGVNAYNPLTEEELIADFDWEKSGDSVEARVPLAALGLQVGQTVGFSAFQEGQSDGWAVDWVESTELTLIEPTASGPLFKTHFRGNGYGFTLDIEETGGAAVDPESIMVTLDGAAAAIDVAANGSITSVSGVHADFLAVGSEHTIGLEFGFIDGGAAQSRDFVFEVAPYAIAAPGYAVPEVDTDAPGFVAGVTQITTAQSDVRDLHNNKAALAEEQLATGFIDDLGFTYWNEANDEEGWVVIPTDLEGVINWNEDSPQPTGHFTEAVGYPDEVIPHIPGWGGTTEGIVVEILAYLELEPGYHTFAVNTISGYKATIGLDGRDKFAPVAGIYEGTRRYSYQGDHYFDIAVQEAGYYPFRLLWFHGGRTNEGAQLEFYSVVDRQKVLVNDRSNPKAVKAYRVSPVQRSYVSRISPEPGNTEVDADATLELEITEGSDTVDIDSIELRVNGDAAAHTATRDGNKIKVSFDPDLALGGSYDVTLSYGLNTDPPTTRTESFTFGVFSDTPLLPAAWATDPGSGENPGFNVRTEQSSAARPNTVAGAEAQLAAGGDLHQGQGVFDVINFESFGSPAGFIPGDADLILSGLVSDDSQDYVSMEAIAYLELTAGLHTFGVNSDDGFRVTAGRRATDNTLELAVFDGDRGTTNMPQNLFSFIAEADGVYAFRLIWFQGTGGASVELYSYNAALNEGTLINDPEWEDSIKAYTSRTGEFADAPVVSIGTSELGIVIEWTGTLQSADSIDGPWTDLTGETSPLVLDPNDSPAKYLRSRAE